MTRSLSSATWPPGLRLCTFGWTQPANLVLSRESCVWSCGTQSRLFRCAEKSVSSLSTSGEAELGFSRDAMVGFVTPGPCSPAMAGCQASSAAWGAFLNIHLRRCLLIAVECAEMGGSGCLDDLGETRLEDLIRRRSAQTASRITPWTRGLAAMRAPGAAMTRALLNPITD